MKNKEKEYKVEGVYIDGGDQDDNGVRSVNETFGATSEKEAHHKFAEIVEKIKKATMFWRSDESTVQTVRLKLKQRNKVIASVNLHQEKSIVAERRTIKPGRGWINEKDWIDKSGERKLKKEGFTLHSLHSSYSRPFGGF